VPLVSAEDGGDEAVRVAGRFAGPVVTGERRVEAAAEACDRFGLDTLVLDDGFQHRALARDADLVLLADDQAARRLLPAGSRREPLAALARARARLAVGQAEPRWPPAPAPPPRFRGRLVPTALVGAGWDEAALVSLTGARVVAVAGIVRPERFTATLERCGARVVDRLIFPDHHDYSTSDV